jgi:hypothetical protein
MNISDLSVNILDLYMNIDLSVNMSFLSVNISDLSEHIILAHEYIRPVYEHTCIRLVCEHINCHINLPSMPVLSYKLAHPSTHACIVIMFAFYVCRLICIYYLTNLFGDHLSQSSRTKHQHQFGGFVNKQKYFCLSCLLYQGHP